MACASRSRGKRAGKSGKIATARERNGTATHMETKVRLYVCFYVFISRIKPKPLVISPPRIVQQDSIAVSIYVTQRVLIVR